jgi:hypothetical protein
VPFLESIEPRLFHLVAVHLEDKLTRDYWVPANQPLQPWVALPGYLPARQLKLERSE